MIKIFLGNLGSGKTASAVREIAEDKSGRKTYTNIKTIGLKNSVVISPSNIIKKTFDEKKKKDVLDVNMEFWSAQKKPLNIIWDEVHLSVSSRSSMSNINMVVSRFVAMARRITGFDEKGYGDFTFIAQTDRTIDINIRDLCNEIRYHVGHWILNCRDCGIRVARDSESRQLNSCINTDCGSWNIYKSDFFIEVYVFKDWEHYANFKCGYAHQHLLRYAINDIHKYFKMYDTLQIGDVWVV